MENRDNKTVWNLAKTFNFNNIVKKRLAHSVAKKRSNANYADAEMTEDIINLIVNT